MQALAFHYGGSSVPNLDQAIAWYSDVLGFALEKRFFLPRLRSDTAFIVRDNVRLELFDVEGATPLPEDRRDPLRDPQTHGTKHVAFQIADLDQFISGMEAKDVEIAIVARASVAGFDACYIRDCAGNLLKFVQL